MNASLNKCTRDKKDQSNFRMQISIKWPLNYNCTVIVADKWSVYDWTGTYLLCVPEASVHSSVSDQQQRDLRNHTEEWSAREQRLDFIHPLGHRTRTLKAWKKKHHIHFSCLSGYIFKISMQNISGERTLYICLIFCDTQWYSKPEMILFLWRSASFFALASPLV